MPSYLLAADEPAEDVSEKVLAEEAAENSGIVSQGSPIIGYQPLTVAGQKIEATYLEEILGERFGAIIFLHDQGEKLEGQGVVTPLRHQMIQYGWSTLTLALDYPFEPAILMSASTVMDENVSEAVPAKPAIDEANVDNKEAESVQQEKALLPPISNQQRIEAAIDLLQAKGVDRIILVGHGSGGNVVIELFDKITTAIAGVVLIGTPELTDENLFKVMQKPILDLYGDKDLKGISEAVQQRKVIMKRAVNSDYSIREVVGADHFYTGLQPTLVNTLRGWLKATFLDEKRSFDAALL